MQRDPFWFSSLPCMPDSSKPSIPFYFPSPDTDLVSPPNTTVPLVDMALLFGQGRFKGRRSRRFPTYLKLSVPFPPSFRAFFPSSVLQCELNRSKSPRCARFLSPFIFLFLWSPLFLPPTPPYPSSALFPCQFPVVERYSPHIYILTAKPVLNWFSSPPVVFSLFFFPLESFE